MDTGENNLPGWGKYLASTITKHREKNKYSDPHIV